MRLSGHQFPVVVWGEERIGMVCILVYEGQQQTMRQGKSLTVDRIATNDKHLLLILASPQSLWQGVIHLASLYDCKLTAQDYVAPIGKRPLGQRLKSAPTHDDGMA